MRLYSSEVCITLKHVVVSLWLCHCVIFVELSVMTAVHDTLALLLRQWHRNTKYDCTMYIYVVRFFLRAQRSCGIQG